MNFTECLVIIVRSIEAGMSIFTALLSSVGAARTYMYMIVVVLAFSAVIIPLVGGRFTVGSDLVRKGNSDKSRQQRSGTYVDRRGTTDGTDRVTYTFGTGGK